MNPAWMHPYQATELYPMAGYGFGETWMGLAPEDSSTISNYNRDSAGSFEPSSTHPNSHLAGHLKVMAGHPARTTVGQEINIVWRTLDLHGNESRPTV
jgi:hypothetical protein